LRSNDHQLAKPFFIDRNRVRWVDRPIACLSPISAEAKTVKECQAERRTDKAGFQAKGITPTNGREIALQEDVCVAARAKRRLSGSQAISSAVSPAGVFLLR
jgi:hypothetical protein